MTYSAPLTDENHHVGGGEIGHALARHLSAAHDIFVIDHTSATSDTSGAP